KSLSVQFSHTPLRQSEINRFTTEIGGQLYIGHSIAYNIGMFQIILSRLVSRKHSRTRFTGRKVLFGKRGVYANLVEANTLVGESLYNFTLHRPKILCRKRRRAHTILI